ncbi:hypothetical protein H6F78_14810 [Coleofasciculus sp. FACHB-64]|uniref:hypothetical protein n=1 Tax=Cyanophyceae TaxID=3028117 RepID=UPI001682FF82|nr:MULTISPECIES: hypothetical protein [unclassified Coleofasciculus]MBD1836914.1 hypothetical protein [Coleofasciculus sp. FACHB-501]MBD1892307.1 hypothetical protein [Coleofasciculus sp. FACHB-SPT9]MBD2046852.1 hypothetical protein [Coleofasciculus sp. FACHB-64]
MELPLFLEQLGRDLNNFQTYLNNQIIQDDDVNTLKNHIYETRILLDKSKTKLTASLNINLPDYPDEDLQQLLYYKDKIIEIQTSLEKLTGVPETLNKIVLNLCKDIDYRIKLRISRGQPKARKRSTNF